MNNSYHTSNSRDVDITSQKSETKVREIPNYTLASHALVQYPSLSMSWPDTLLLIIIVIKKSTAKNEMPLSQLGYLYINLAMRICFLMTWMK